MDGYPHIEDSNESAANMQTIAALINHPEPDIEIEDATAEIGGGAE